MRQEVYRVAYDEASAELSEILAKFEQLRLRKDRIEKVVEALKPLISVSDLPISNAEKNATLIERQPVVADQQVMHAPAASQPVPTPMPYPVQPVAEETNDPFSRRVDSSIGVSAAAKDVREYSRLFNTGTSR
ncbi:MAG TPA: hypothetical protein VK716_03025 [Terracidiphilus sp.]|jgi:hypothetical protein|nr:hypothetical protein [Terracidiphilus sp.]